MAVGRAKDIISRRGGPIWNLFRKGRTHSVLATALKSAVGQRRTYRRPCGMSALLPSSDIGDSGSAVRLVPGLASLRPSQVPAQDSAGRLLPKQDRRAWEVEEELEEELEGVLFATPGRPAREDLDVGCWKSSTVGCWKSSAAASLDSAESPPAPSARRVDGLFFSNPPVELRSSA